MLSTEQLELSNCIDVDDPEIFFATSETTVGRNNIYAAKMICEKCPIKSACLQEAMNEDLYGIWGGTTELERDKMRRGIPLTPLVPKVLTPQVAEKFTSANERRQQAAAQTSIGYLSVALTMLNLPQDTRELIQARIDNPDLSLVEIGQLMPTPMSKHSVAGKLRRVIAEVKENDN